MFITGVKTAIVEALNAGFAALGAPTSNNTLDLTPNSVTIEYPLEEVAWPAVFVQFRPSKSQYSGLNPDIFYPYPSVENSILTTRQIYFEGVIDLQILAMHSEERDKLKDSLVNLILMNSGSPASVVFYTSIAENDLIELTLLPSTVTNLGDTVSQGTPFSPEELTYEDSIRVNCVGQSIESKYNVVQPTVTTITASGEITIPLTLT